MSQVTISSSVKNEVKNILQLGIPLIASQLVYACSGFIGTAFVARLGEEALAASILVSTIWMSLSVMFFGILNSISVLVSHQYGANNPRNISIIMGQAVWLGVIVCITMVLILSAMPFFLRFANQPVEVHRLAIHYMRALLWTVPGLITLIIYEQFLAGVNRTRMVLRISLMVVPIEIPIIYILIFGKFGMPELGVAGVGYGFAITYTCTAIFLTSYLWKSKHYRKFALFSSLKQFNFRWFKELIRIGLPIGTMHVIEVGTFTFCTFWMAQFGTTMLAAHQIIMQYLGFVITLVFAMSQAVTIRVGLAVGQLNESAIRYTIYVGMVLNFICILIVSIAFNLWPTFFLRIDIDVFAAKNALLVRDAASLLGIMGILIIFDNFRIIGFGALRGFKDTKFPMYVSLVSFVMIGMSMSYLLGFVFGYSGNGIWAGLAVGIAFGALILFARIQWLLKRLNLEKILHVPH